MGHWLRNALSVVFGALGVAVALRVVRARNVSSALVHRGEEEAARHEPFPPLATGTSAASTAATEDLGRAPMPPLPLAAVAVDPQHSVQAVPVAIVGGGGLGGGGFGAAGAAPAGPPTFEQVEAAVQKKGLRIRGRHYGLKVVSATIGATLLVLVLGGFLAMKMLMGGGGESTDDVALEEFGSLGATGASGTTTTLAPGETAPVDASTDATSGDAASATATDSSTGTGESGGGGTVAVLRPPDGTYTYAGSGQFETKVLSFGGTTQMPSSVEAVVSPNSSCWNFAITLFPPDKIETPVFCPGADGSLSQPGEKRHQKQFGLTIDSTIVCKPSRPWVTPGMQPGQQFQSQCTIDNKGAINSSSQAPGTVTYVGLETVNVGGQAVQAYHLRLDEQTSGQDVKGPVNVDNWFATSNGLLLQTQRKQRLTGFAAYNEDSLFTLKSLTPK